MSDSREHILKKIREATAIKSKLPGLPAENDHQLHLKLAGVTPENPDDLLKQFISELSALSAEFHLINTWDDAAPIIHNIISQNGYRTMAYADQLECALVAGQVILTENSFKVIKATDLPYPQRKPELAGIPAALVKAAFAVADIGSLVFPYDENGTTLPHFLADCVFCLVHRRDLLANQFDLFKILRPDRAKNMVFITGPSRTADIEKVLVLGAHGPKRLIVLMINNLEN